MRRADRSDCPGFPGMAGRACEDAALRRPMGWIAPWISSGTLPLFDLQPRAGDARPELFFLSASGLFKASVPSDHQRVLDSCRPTRALRGERPEDARSRTAFLPRELPGGLPLDSPFRLPGFWTPGHPGRVRRLFPARGLQRLGGSGRALGAGCTEEGAPRALGAPSTPWTGRSGVACSRPSRQPPRCHSALSSGAFFLECGHPASSKIPSASLSPGLPQPRVGAAQVLSKCGGHEENPGPGCSKQPAPFSAT